MRITQLRSREWEDIPADVTSDPAVSIFEEDDTSVHDLELHRAMRSLSDMERVVLTLRFGLKGKTLTLEEIADSVCMSVSKVWQIEQQALERLRMGFGLATAVEGEAQAA